MRKSYLSQLLMLALLAWAIPASAADTLVVVMERQDGGKQIHHKVIDPVDCRQVVERLRSNGPFMLTLNLQKRTTGRVIEAHCVLPDGSIEPRAKR
jgi:hypothetical protein